MSKQWDKNISLFFFESFLGTVFGHFSFFFAVELPAMCFLRLASPLRPGQPDVVKLVDFGLSKDISGCASGTSTPFLGTKYYRAPETRHTLPGQENYDAAKAQQNKGAKMR